MNWSWYRRPIVLRCRHHLPRAIVGLKTERINGLGVITNADAVVVAVGQQPTGSVGTMTIRKFILFSAVLIASSLAEPIKQPLPSVSIIDSLDECLRKDSISCVQIQVFRNLRSFFDQESVELIGGLSLVKNEPIVEKDEKVGRAIAKEDDASEMEIMTAANAEDRENALESYAIAKIDRFFKERSLTWNLSPMVNEVAETARGIVNSIPASVKEKISDFVNEGRGKKKKLLKALLPFLIGLKLKIAGFLGLAYIVIALIAKKAILASLISLAISGFIALKKLLASKQHHGGHYSAVEVHPVEYSSHGGGYGGGFGGGGGGYISSSGWDSYGGHGDSHGSYSNNVAHSLAYSAQKPVRR